VLDGTWRRRGALLVVFALLAGCGPYIQEVNAEHRDKVEAKLPQIKAVGEALAKTPPLGATIPIQAKLRLSLDYFPRATDNAAVIYAEDFRNLDELGLVKNRMAYANLVSRCSAAVHTEREPWNPSAPGSIPPGISGSTAARAYAVCEKLEYLVVLRTRAFAAVDKTPSATGTTSGAANTGAGDAGAAGAGDAGGASVADAGTKAAPSSSTSTLREFAGGYLDAEALVFEVASAKLVGGFRFEAESSRSLETDRSGSAIERDFEAAVLAAFRDSLRKHSPEVDFSDWKGGK